MNKFLSEVKGFTPVIDVLVHELGLMPAVAYGVVWRYCQMEDGVCKASMAKIARRIGVDRATLHRHIKALCEAGYLKDLTPGLKNCPHTYADTGRAKINGLLAVKSSVAESNSKLQTVAECNSSEKLLQSAPPTVAESPMKIPIKRSLKDKEREISNSNFPSSDFSTESYCDDDIPEGSLIDTTIEKLSCTFGDPDHLKKSNKTRARNLWRNRPELEEEEFAEIIEEAAAITKGEISKGNVQRDKRMAYFFAVLEDQLGLRG
jgi:DNA-binding Lrp family transcriptional regulator